MVSYTFHTEAQNPFELGFSCLEIIALIVNEVTIIDQVKIDIADRLASIFQGGA